MSAPPPIAYPHPVLTPIIGDPTNASLTILKKQIYANAQAAHSARGGGAHGHISLVMSPAEYTALDAPAFINPVDPGNQPAALPAAATQFQIAEALRRFSADAAEYKYFHNIQNQLRAQIIAAVPKLYLDHLESDTLGLSNVSCITMLQHLTTTYGTITIDDLLTNRESLKPTWNPDEPIETLWARIRIAQQFAVRGGEALTEKFIIATILPVFAQTGVFTEAISVWRRTDEATWTLATFQAHFKKENATRLSLLAAQTAGYHGAHAAQTLPPGNQPPPTALSAATPSTIIGKKEYFYCWTHGLGTNPKHTSATCERKKAGHDDTATLANMNEGCATIWQRKPPGSKKPAAPLPQNS
jgi:hypothetical protein